MSIRPVSIEGDVWHVWHDELNHGGDVLRSELSHPVDTAGNPIEDIVGLPCPFDGCGWSSWHPVTGGAAPAAVQLMHVVMRLDARRAADADAPFDQAVADVRARVVELEGAERWKLDGLTEAKLGSFLADLEPTATTEGAER